VLRLLALLTLLGAAIVLLPGCGSLSEEDAAKVRAAFDAAQQRVGQLETSLDQAREFSESLDERFAQAISERDAARQQIEALELQVADAIAAGRSDEIRDLQQQIAELRPSADAKGLDELRKTAAKVTEFIGDKEDELETVVGAVRQLDASLVSVSGDVDWGGVISAAASILAAIGLAVDGRKKRQQRDSAITVAQRVAIGARESVLAIDRAREQHGSTWETLARAIKAQQPREARELVEWAKGKNTDRELDELIARTPRRSHQ
jgi:hypothetical protein